MKIQCSVVVLHIWPYKSMEERAAVRASCAEDPEVSQSSKHIAMYIGYIAIFSHI